MAYEYYSLLGLDRNASEADIKKAYRKKAMECHPDRCAGDKQKEAEFKKVNEAYSVLSDPAKKAQYDRFGSTDSMNGFGGFGGGFQGGFDAADLGDIFSQFFGGGFGGQTRARRRADIGEDIEIRLKISLEDAIRGVSRKVEYERYTTCDTCNGSGGKRVTCDTCNGSGHTRERVQTVFGVMEQQITCRHCGGYGNVISEACKTCDGDGKIRNTVEKTIDIPAGIEDGMSIKIRDEGHVGRDGSGDLYVTVSVPTSEGGLTRRGKNIFYTVPISPAEAVLGTSKQIQIPILGKKTLNIGSGTAHGSEIRFTREGIVSLDSGSAGDLIIILEVSIPKKISSDQKKLYEALLQSEGGKPKKGWLEEFFGS